MGELVKAKSALHRRLEETLTKNKVEVLRLVSTNGSNASEIVRLREQAASMTKQLTNEMRREMKVEEEEKNKTIHGSPTNSITSWNVTTGTNNVMVNGEMSRILLVLSHLQQSINTDRVGREMNLMLLLFCLSLVILVVLWQKPPVVKTLCFC